MFSQRIVRLFSLLVLPRLLLFSAWKVRTAQGPYYSFQASDPEYVYLINSLNLAHLKKPGHVDHPGTPVQMLGAVVIRVKHLVDRISEENLVEDALKHPENYLATLNTVIVGLILLTMLITGFWAYTFSGNLWSVWMLQAAPFFSVAALMALKDVSPEPLLLVVSLLLNAVLYRLLVKGDLQQRMGWYVTSFATLFALGLATKFTFIPVAAIPLCVLPGLKRKLFFLTLSGILFTVFIFPALARLSYLYQWLTGLVVHSGQYGSGAATVVDLTAFRGNLQRILFSEVFFTFTLALVLLVLFLVFRRKHVLKDFTASAHKVRLRLVTGIAVSMLVQTIMVAKHYRSHYMLPSLMLIAVALIALIMEAKTMRIRENQFSLVSSQKVLGILAFLLIPLLWIHSFQTAAGYALLQHFNRGSQQINAFVRTVYPNVLKVYYYPASTDLYAMSFSMNFGGRLDYKTTLQSLHPSNDYLFLDILSGYVIEDWRNSFDRDALRKKLQGKKLIFQGGIDLNVNQLEQTYKLKLKEVFSVSDNRLYGPEKVYEAELLP